jgi:hypothetical protein
MPAQTRNLTIKKAREVGVAQKKMNHSQTLAQIKGGRQIFARARNDGDAAPVCSLTRTLARKRTMQKSFNLLY